MQPMARSGRTKEQAWRFVPPCCACAYLYIAYAACTRNDSCARACTCVHAPKRERAHANAHHPCMLRFPTPMHASIHNSRRPRAPVLKRIPNRGPNRIMIGPSQSVGIRVCGRLWSAHNAPITRNISVIQSGFLEASVFSHRLLKKNGNTEPGISELAAAASVATCVRT